MSSLLLGVALALNYEKPSIARRDLACYSIGASLKLKTCLLLNKHTT